MLPQAPGRHSGHLLCTPAGRHKLGVFVVNHQPSLALGLDVWHLTLRVLLLDSVKAH